MFLTGRIISDAFLSSFSVFSKSYKMSFLLFNKKFFLQNIFTYYKYIMLMFLFKTITY